MGEMVVKLGHLSDKLIYSLLFKRDRPMWIILLGAPGSGKGTQAEFLCKAFNLYRLSTGDLLRAEIAAGTELGRAFKKTLESGQLGSDDIVIQLVKDQMATVRAKGKTKGFLFDGFPRTLQQAKALQSFGSPVDYVVYLDVTDESIVERLSGRRIHPASGRTYHVKLHPNNVDDVTGEPLIQREDDKEHVVRERLAVYHQQTEPLIEWYQNQPVEFISVPAEGSVQDVQSAIEQELKLKKKHLEKE